MSAGRVAFAMSLQGIDRIEHAAKRIVDFMRHARGQPSEAREAFLLGKSAASVSRSLTARTNPLYRLNRR